MLLGAGSAQGPACGSGAAGAGGARFGDSWAGSVDGPGLLQAALAVTMIIAKRAQRLTPAL
jgi:hypothetical protein